MKLIFGHDKKLAEWAQGKIPGAGSLTPCRAIGVADNDNTLFAVVVYNNWYEEIGCCSITFCAANPRWAQKGIIRALLSVPFEQYKVRKLYSTIESTNAKSIKLTKGLGFKQEAVLRHHFGHKRHAIVSSLMAHEFVDRYCGEKIVLTKTKKSPSPENG